MGRSQESSGRGAPDGGDAARARALAEIFGDGGAEPRPQAADEPMVDEGLAALFGAARAEGPQTPQERAGSGDAVADDDALSALFAAGRAERAAAPGRMSVQTAEASLLASEGDRDTRRSAPVQEKAQTAEAVARAAEPDDAPPAGEPEHHDPSEPERYEPPVPEERHAPEAESVAPAPEAHEPVAPAPEAPAPEASVPEAPAAEAPALADAVDAARADTRAHGAPASDHDSPAEAAGEDFAHRNSQPVAEETSAAAGVGAAPHPAPDAVEVVAPASDGSDAPTGGAGRSSAMDEIDALFGQLMADTGAVPTVDEPEKPHAAAGIPWLRTGASRTDVPDPNAVASDAAGEATSRRAAADAAAAEEKRATATRARASTDPVGTFGRRRGAGAGWGRRQWAVVVSVVAVGVIAGAAILLAQTISHGNAVAAAVAGLEHAGQQSASAHEAFDAALVAYDDQAASAQAMADAAGTPLRVVKDKSDPDALDPALQAIRGLRAQLEEPPPAAPEPWAPGDVDESDLAALEAATQAGQAHIVAVESATTTTTAATAALQEQMQALTAAELALGATFPATALRIVDENPIPLEQFRTDVIDAAEAIPAAQDDGGTGHAEMIEYARKVDALREEEARLEVIYPWLAPVTEEAADEPSADVTP